MTDDSLIFPDTCGNHLCEIGGHKCMPEIKHLMNWSQSNQLGYLEKGSVVTRFKAIFTDPSQFS